MAGDVVHSMRDYYARRAAYYERVYFKPERQADLRAMEAWLPAPLPAAACWNGLRHRLVDTSWRTRCGALAGHRPEPRDLGRGADQAAAGLRGTGHGGCLHAGRIGRAPLRRAFAGCWWSHVPLQRLAGWLQTLHARLEPGARVVFLDNSFVQTSSTPISRCDEQGNTYQQRTLDDGSVHEVLKNFPTPNKPLPCWARARGRCVAGPTTRTTGCSATSWPELMPLLTGLTLLLLVPIGRRGAGAAAHWPLPARCWACADGALLRWPAVRAPVEAAATPLLAHLSLLFVPVGVGVVAHLGLIGQYGPRMLLAWCCPPGSGCW
jgi:hypothetical protein